MFCFGLRGSCDVVVPSDPSGAGLIPSDVSAMSSGSICRVHRQRGRLIVLKVQDRYPRGRKSTQSSYLGNSKRYGRTSSKVLAISSPAVSTHIDSARHVRLSPQVSLTSVFLASSPPMAGPVDPATSISLTTSVSLAPSSNSPICDSAPCGRNVIG